MLMRLNPVLLNKYATFGFALALLLALVGLWAVFRSGRRLVGHTAWVTHSGEVRWEIVAADRELLQAESAARGFALRGNELCLFPFADAGRSLRRHLEALRRLTRDNPGQQARLDRMEPLMFMRLAQLEQVVAEGRAVGGPGEAAREVNEGAGEALTGAIQGELGELAAHELSLVSLRNQTVLREQHRLNFLIVALGSGFLLVEVLAFLALRMASRERLLTAEQLRHVALDLQRSNRDLEQFASVASHDLQEPLRMVASFTELLGQRYRGRLDAEADQFIAFAVDGAKRMQTLINDLLQYARLVSRAVPAVICPVEAALDQALLALAQAMLETEAQVTRDPLPEILGDPSQVALLFQNLLGNALKFRCPGRRPCVHVSAVPEGARWQFSVADNGIGIDPAHFEIIFQIFRRLHGSADYPGTGIGLAICKRIVERHGGVIRVLSQPGQGATFTFSLPRPGADP